MDFSDWTAATGNLDWGTQRVMHETINLASEGKIHLVHGADFKTGHPCLVNSVAQMIAKDVEVVHPGGWFPDIVKAFDRINSEFVAMGVNSGDGFVSEIAASALLANFAPLKPVPTAAEQALKTLESAPYHEPTDAEFADMLGKMDAPVEVEVVDDLSNVEAL